MQNLENIDDEDIFSEAEELGNEITKVFNESYESKNANVIVYKSMLEKIKPKTCWFCKLLLF